MKTTKLVLSVATVSVLMVSAGYAETITKPKTTPYAAPAAVAPMSPPPAVRAQTGMTTNAQLSDMARLQVELRQTKQELAELKRVYGEFMREYRAHTHVIDAQQYPLSVVLRDQQHFADLKVLLVPGTAAARTKGVLPTSWQPIQ